MRNKQLSIFSSEWKRKFTKENAEAIIEAFDDFEQMPKEDCYIRSSTDFILSLAANSEGLNIWDENFRPAPGSRSDMFRPFIEDYRMIKPEQRVKKLVAFDTETTGQSNSYIVSIAIVILNLETMEIEDEYYSLVNPLAKIEADAYKVHKITQAEADAAKTFEELEPEIKNMFKKGEIICGQNIETFDLRVMEREYDRINCGNPLLDMPIFDTMHMVKVIVGATDRKGRLKNPKVEETMKFFNIPQPDGEYHNALTDTKACAGIVKALFSHRYPMAD